MLYTHILRILGEFIGFVEFRRFGGYGGNIEEIL